MTRADRRRAVRDEPEEVDDDLVESDAYDTELEDELAEDDEELEEDDEDLEDEDLDEDDDDDDDSGRGRRAVGSGSAPRLDVPFASVSPLLAARALLLVVIPAAVWIAGSYAVASFSFLILAGVVAGSLVPDGPAPDAAATD